MVTNYGPKSLETKPNVFAELDPTTVVGPILDLEGTDMPIVETEALSLKLLGYPEVYWEDERLKLPTQKLRALLYFLAVKGQASREELGELLWEAEARHRLRPELHRLKKLAGAEAWLELDDIASVEVVTDLSLFEARVREERYGEALTLYPEKAYLLQGFILEDAPQFMDWLSEERERVSALYIRALRGRAEELSHRKQVAEALHLVHLMIDLDPLDESAYRLAMRLEYSRGHIQAALKQFETCRRVLAEELSVEPLEETLALVREIEKGQALPEFAIAEQRRLPAQLLRPPSLIARETEWARMEEAFQKGQTIFISGPPGVGKTRLLLDFASSKGDVTIIEGRIGDENIPFITARRGINGYLAAYPDDPLEPWVMDGLARILYYDHTAEPFSVPTEEEKLHLQKAMVAFLKHSSKNMGVFPADNLHAFDSLSIEIINRAADEFFRQATFNSKSVIAMNTFRLGEMHDEFKQTLEHFITQGFGVHIELEPLDLEAVKKLLQSLELDQEGLAPKLHRLTGGNPQFIVETLKTLFVTGQLESVPERIALPERLGYVLSKRLDDLSTLALRIAKAVATLEQDLSTEELAALLELNAFDVAEGIAELEAVQVFAQNQFVHDLIQESAKRQTPAAVQRLLHGRMASLLEEGQPDAARIAHHYLVADERTKALPWRLKAIEDAISKGFIDEASSWLEDLLFEAPEESETYPQALVLKGQILLQQDLAKAEACFKEALELSKYLYTDTEVMALEGLAQCARKQRNFEAANSYLEKALEYPMQAEKKAALRLLQSIFHAQNSCLDEAEQALTEALAIAPDNPKNQMALATLRFHQGTLRRKRQAPSRLLKASA